MRLPRYPVNLLDRELRFLAGVADLRGGKAAELSFRGLRARYAVARELSTFPVMAAPPDNPKVDLFHRGWSLKVKSCSVTVGAPALWFRSRNHPWDAAVLVAHHPQVRDTVWICGWLSREDWQDMAAPSTRFKKDVFAVPEECLQPFHTLLRARMRWESL